MFPCVCMQVEVVVLSPEGGSMVGFAPRSDEGFVSEAVSLARTRVPAGQKASRAGEDVYVLVDCSVGI